MKWEGALSWETEIDMEPTDRVAAAAVVGITNIDLRGNAEFHIQTIIGEANGDPSVIADAKSATWLDELEVTTWTQFVTRIAMDNPFPAGFKGRVVDLLNAAELKALDRS